MQELTNQVEVFSSPVDRSVVIRWHGALNSENCEVLGRRIDLAFIEGLRRFRIDLDEDVAVDASGLRCLDETAGHCAPLGISFDVQPSLAGLR
jgi:hypothetical protein